MKSLKSFLLEEAASNKVPKGFTIISNMGSASKEAQEAIGAKSFGSARSKASESKGRAEIIEKLGGSGMQGNSAFEILDNIVGKQTNDLDEAFKRTVDKADLGGEEVAIVNIIPGWESHAGQGKTSSSQRLIKFWLASVLMAYGGYDYKSYNFAISNDNRMAIWKR